MIGFFPVRILAWDGMPTPALHIEGNKLKDPTGKDVLLHGWMQPTESWFNGEGYRYSNPTDWTSTENVAGMLNFLRDAATVMSDVSPKYGQNHGWYCSFVRVNTDAVGGWTSESGLVDTIQFDAWISNFLVPYVSHLRSRGLYLVLCATGPVVVNVNDDGSRNASLGTQSRLLAFWERIANAPGIKNADNVMFELMNEPVQIESSPGNGNWGMGSATYWKAFRDWIQPIINTIRNTGADNIIWVPTLGWQGEPHGWVQYPFSGTNIGVAAHYYPAYGSVHNNTTAVQNLWNSNYKPAADRWPMIITEMMWFPNEPGGYDDLFNGTTAGFGNAVRKAMDRQGNVSYLVGFLGDHLANLRTSLPADCPLGSLEGAQSYFEWLPTYAWAGPDDGTPEYLSAAVTDENPRRIQVIISQPVQESSNFDGFTVKVDGQIVVIDSVVSGDTSNQLMICLNDSIFNDDEIILSYSEGNVVSIYDKNLDDFSDELVFNLLDRAAPIITELVTSENGDTLISKFSKKMIIPSDLLSMKLNAEYNGDKVPILLSSVTGDSALLLFSLAEKVYADYKLLLSYTGSNILSSDSGLLDTFSDYPVTNNARGLPVRIEDGMVQSNGISVVLAFSKPLAIAVGQSVHFTLNVNGESVPFKDFHVSDSTVRFSLLNDIHHDDTVTAGYTPGNITATDKGALHGFSDFALANLVTEPTWTSIPGKVEAENYAVQFGTQTEQTRDAGGGLNVGWIDSGDWLDYAVENHTTDTLFEISFRVAAPNDGCMLEFYLDGDRIGRLAVPNTGNWQTWRSISDDISISQGKHYLKVIATNGGFNINYIDIQPAPAQPVKIDGGVTDENGRAVILDFSKSIAANTVQPDYFNLIVNGQSVSISGSSVSEDTIRLSPKNLIRYGDDLSVSYTRGDIAASDGGVLDGFSDFTITNLVKEPAWILIPGKMEAEDYSLQVGTETQETGDAGGGLMVCSVDDGNWLEYAIENNMTDSLYEIAFRIATPFDDGILDIYLDNLVAGQVMLPNTGDWQSWQSVVFDMTIGHGKHYFKVVSGGNDFHINYIDFERNTTLIKEIKDEHVAIYPNPVSNEMIISSTVFRFNKVEIIDMSGQTVLSQVVARVPELHLRVNLPNGIYVVKISDGLHFQLRMIVIDNT